MSKKPDDGEDGKVFELLAPIMSTESVKKTASDESTDALIEAINSLDGNRATICVMRESDDQAPSEHIVTVSADKYPIDGLLQFIQDNFGGGDYRIQVKDFRSRIKASRLYRIAKAINAVSPVEDRTAEILERIERSGKLLDNAQHSQQNESEIRRKVLKEMLFMKEIFANNQPQNTIQPIDIFEQIKSLFELTDMMKDRSSDSDNNHSILGEAIKDGIPLLKSIIETSQQQQQQQQQQQPSAHITQPITPKQTISLEKTILDEAVKMLNQGDTPEKIGEFIYNEIPPKFAVKIEALITSDNAIDKCILITPEIANHRESFLDLIEWVKAYYGLDSKYTDFFEAEKKEEKKSNLDLIDKKKIN